MPVLGLRLDFFDKGVSLAFSADTAPSDTVASLATGCDLLIHEASFSATLQPDVSPELFFHSDARQAGQIAARAGAKRLALVHLSSLHSNHRRVLTAEAAETFQRLDPGARRRRCDSARTWSELTSRLRCRAL